MCAPISKLDLTGHLTHSTPDFVKDDVLRSHGYRIKNWDSINYEAINRKIERTPIITYEQKARFLNPDISVLWTKKQIDEGIRNFYILTFKYPTTDLHPGYSFPNIANYHPSLIYYWCVRYNIHLDTKTSIDKAVSKLKRRIICMNKNRETLIQRIYSYVRNLNINDIYNIIDTFDISIDTNIDFSKVFMKLEDRKPSTDEEAIILSSSNYQLDLTRAEDPLDEYYHRSKSDDYYPKDPQIRKIYGTNPSLISTLSSFNYLLPESCYKRHLLQCFIDEEGLESHFTDLDIYSRLSYVTQGDNFYRGNQPELTTDEAQYTMEDISDLHEVISFGTRHHSMIFYSLEGLWMFLKNNHNHSFEDYQISKLRMICREINTEESNGILILLDSIDLLKKKNDLIIERYTLSLANNCENIRNIIRDLYYVTLYMRGWDGKSEHPLYNVPSCNIEEAEERTLIHISQLMNNDNYEIIKDLELYTYKESLCKVNMTINERLDIILNHKESINACIRLSSNVFLYTIYVYAFIYDNNDKISIFNPGDIREIG
jgi:3'-phosphoadenosine 5'-phosphosulfate sulfotransferase